MKVKQKLILIGCSVAGALTVLTVVFFVTKLAVQSKLNNAVSLSNSAVASSEVAEQTLSNTQTRLDQMTSKLTESIVPLESNKQRLSILEKKIDSFDSRLTDLENFLNNVLDKVPEDSDAMFELEDALFELDDIKTELKRELQSNIESTAIANLKVSDDVFSSADELTNLNQQFQTSFTELVGINRSNVEKNSEAIQTISDASIQQSVTSNIFSIVLMALAAGVSGSMMYIYLLVTRPLQNMQEGISQLSNGNLTSQIKVTRKDEFGLLASNTNQMVSKIRNVISEISQEATQLLNIANEIKANSIATKSAVDSERDDVHSVVSATNQMLKTVDTVASSSNESLASSAASSEASDEGIVIVKDNINKVNSLSSEFSQAASVVANVEKHTTEIDQILHVIKDITEQTNLLALNAAIEAARAGEQGRGFAVVADEVRQLAQRTQKSTEQITGIIDSLIQSATSAVKHMKNSEIGVTETIEEARKIHTIFEVIASKVEGIKEKTNSVSDASKEQAVVSQDVQTKMMHIDKETEKIYNMANEVVSKSYSLKDVSQRIAGQLQQFNV